MELLILVATLFSTFNVILLIGLIYLYARIVTKTHAGYSAGLLILRGPPPLPQHRHPLRLYSDGNALQRPALSLPGGHNGLRVRRALGAPESHRLVSSHAAQFRYLERLTPDHEGFKGVRGCPSAARTARSAFLQGRHLELPIGRNLGRDATPRSRPRRGREHPRGDQGRRLAACHRIGSSSSERTSLF